jgi:hypothetical protein
MNKRLILEIFSRGTARLKRIIQKRLVFNQSGFVSLMHGEFLSDISWTKVERVVESCSIEVMNPRTSEVEGHFFSSRYQVKLENSKIVVDTKTGIVHIGSRIVTESSAWPQNWLSLNPIPKPSRFGLQELDYIKKYVVLPSNGFYHSLIEDIPLFLRQLESEPDSTILLYKDTFPWLRELAIDSHCELLEIDRFVSLKEHTFIARSADTGWPHPSDIDLLRGYFLREKLVKSELKVFISRVNSSRSPRFERQLCDELRNLDWEVVYAEQLSLKEQIDIMSSAKHIAGVHGAGLAGMIWMPEGSTVSELGPTRFVPCFCRLAKVSNLKYRRLQYKDTPESYHQILDWLISS